MRGRRFLEVARMAVEDADEVWQRTAAGRAYYGLLIEARDALLRWATGPVPSFQAHAYVRTRFLYAAFPDLKRIGEVLDGLFDLRNRADYQTNATFDSAFLIEEAINDAESAIDALDSIDANSDRRTAAASAIRAIP